MSPEPRGSSPAPGDILVSKRSASTMYELSVVSGPAQLSIGDYESAIDRARTIGERLAVDVWFTEDGVSTVCVARYRTGRP